MLTSITEEYVKDSKFSESFLVSRKETKAAGERDNILADGYCQIQ
jgi:hypothetical protein